MMEYNWLPKSLDYVEAYRIDKEMVEAVIARPTSTGLHPASGDHGYPIKSYRRGDMEVCVSFKPGEDPAIAYVHLHLPIDSSKGSSTGGGPVRKAASKAPNGMRQFKQWLHDAGFVPKLRNGHIHVLRKNGTLLMVTSSTPGDKMALTAAWQKFLREAAKDSVRESLDEDPSNDTWMCPHCGDHYGPDDEDQPPVCDMCKKAGRT